MAVVIHCGSGPNRGHYISIVKSHGFWLLFDDDQVDVNIRRNCNSSCLSNGVVFFFRKSMPQQLKISMALHLITKNHQKLATYFSIKVAKVYEQFFKLALNNNKKKMRR